MECSVSEARVKELVVGEAINVETEVFVADCDKAIKVGVGSDRPETVGV
jgi:hypothetical protein